MPLNWINASKYSFNALLLMERFQLRLMLESRGWNSDKKEWTQNMGIALNANQSIRWYLEHRCPEYVSIISEICNNSPKANDAVQVRNAEIYILSSIEDFVIYTTPEVMADKCDFIKGWDAKRLYELADFTNKTVLDVGAGSGRLAFAAACKAAWVYASEPVETLREFMRTKAAKDGIKNIRIVDGLVTDLPYPDNTFDIVMSGHVVGDDWDNEINELTRVCKTGGWLIDCPGDSLHNMRSSTELVKRGWEEFHYIGYFGKDVFVRRKQIIK